MAATFRFENRDASTTVDLIGDFKLLGLRQQYSMGDGRVTEVYRLMSVEDTKAATRTLVNQLDDILQDAFLWHDDPLEADSIWLRWLSDGESAKRALVESYELTIEEQQLYNRFLGSAAELYVNLAVTRVGDWESESATTISTSTNLTADADQWDGTATTGGKRDGRIADLNITPTDDIARIWLGIKPKRSGVSTFVSEYECEDGSTTNLTDHDTSVVVVAGTSGGSVMETTFATETGMNWRFYLDPFDGTSMTQADGRGRYRFLVRARIVNGSGGDVQVAVRGGVSWVNPSYDSPVLQNETRFLTKTEHSTSWRILDLGEVQIPPRVYRGPFADADVNVAELSLNIEASLLAGTANSDKVQWDSIYLVPSEHMIIWEDAIIYGTGAQQAKVFTYENGEVDAYVFNPLSASQILGAPAITAINWAWPKDGGLVVLVAEGDTAHVLADDTALSMDIYKRWGVFRE